MLRFIILACIAVGCGSNQREIEKLKEKLSSVEKKNKLLSEKFNVIDSTDTGYAPVTIENSEIRQVRSTGGNRTYDIYIQYPPNHRTSGIKYQTLYILDAEVNFGAMSYITQRLAKDNLIPEIILIGIAYPGKYDEDDYYSLRCLDLTPTEDKSFTDSHENLKAGSGGALAFTAFLDHDLFPFIETNFPVDPGARTLYGHSLGGLFGFYTIFNRSELFSNYLLLSPSLWWDDHQIFSKSELFKLKNKVRLYTVVGKLENSKDSKDGRSMVDDLVAMVSILKQNNGSNLAIRGEALENETHRTIFGPGVTNGLRFLYSKK